MTRDSKRWVCKLISYLREVPVETAVSDVSGELTVQWVNGRLVLDSPNANYSYGSLHRLFQKVFHLLDLKNAPPSDILLLGFGGGSVVSILRDEYRLGVPVTAVESDPEVIRLARSHFGAGNHQNLQIVCSDAAAYMSAVKDSFGMIIVDLFVDNSVPEIFTMEPFLSDCRRTLKENGILILISSSVRISRKHVTPRSGRISNGRASGSPKSGSLPRTGS